MKKILLSTLLIAGLGAHAQEYFSAEGRANELARMEEKMLEGCTVKLNEQPAITSAEMKYNAVGIKNFLSQFFSQSFNENPNIKEALDQELDSLSADPSCETKGNTCRTRLAAVALYYIQKLRPDVPGCESGSGAINSGGFDCSSEKKYRKKVLSNFGYSNGGMNQEKLYTEILTKQLNEATSVILDQTLSVTTFKEKKKGVERTLDTSKKAICGQTTNGAPNYEYKLKFNLSNQPFTGVDLNKPPEEIKPPSEDKKIVVEKKPEPCVEDIKVLYNEFVPLNFEEGSATVKSSEVKPVKQKIEDFISSHSSMVITHIDVTSSSSKTPFYKLENGKKVYDKKYSNEKNLALARSRAGFAETALSSIKANHSELSEAQYSTQGDIYGPEFDENDLSDRNISSKSSQYKALAEKIFAKYKDQLAKEAMIKSANELLDSNRFKNLYEAKYKPYQGFKIVISGYSKESRKCGDKEKSSEAKPSIKTEKSQKSTGSGQGQN